MRLSTVLVVVGLAAAGLAAAAAMPQVVWRIGMLQQEVQAALAGRLQALRDGAPLALASLMAICGFYGLAHAVGPGHGKALIAGAAVASHTSARRMALIALAGSLAQAVFAVVIVYGALAVLEVSTRTTLETTERWTVPLGNAAIAVIGAWLLWRGVIALTRLFRKGKHAHAPGCGHAHGPDADAVAGARGIGGALALVVAMALRPCTGALIVLALAWRMDIAVAGALGVLAMGLGTASFTAGVACFAVAGRRAAVGGTGGARRIVAPALQIVVGGLMLVVATASAMYPPGVRFDGPQVPAQPGRAQAADASSG